MTAPLLSRLATAKNGLEDAHITLCGALTAHVEARRELELAEAYRLNDGVGGKNERERSANLRLELAPEHAALHEAEDALTEALCAYEVARLEWDLVRYELRAVTHYPLKAAT